MGVNAIINVLLRQSGSTMWIAMGLVICTLAWLRANPDCPEAQTAADTGSSDTAM